jgi:rhomboid protease GluP
MDLNNLLLWIVCLSCVSTLILAVRISANNNRGWIFVSAAILVATAAMFYLTPKVAGLIGGALWAIFIVLPNLGNRRVNQLVTQQRFGQASKVARFISWLHPADGWRTQPDFLRALWMGQRGDIVEAMAILHRYQTVKTPSGRLAIATIYQLDARWEDLLMWIQTIPESVLQQDFDLLLCYLRSLGETSDLNGLLAAWERYEPRLEKNPNIVTRNLVRLYVLAFCGQKEQVVTLFNTSLSAYSPAIKNFWLATTDQAQGYQIAARELLLTIPENSDLRLVSAVKRRLSQPVLIAETLSEKSQEILYRVCIEAEHEARYRRKSSRQPNATYFIIALNLLTFALEVKFGGSTNPNTLIKLGALIPENVIAGEWWRLLTGTFLHFGFLHLFMNMYALYLFGRLVELSLGVPRYLLLYFTTGIGSMLAVTYMSVMGYARTDFAVGASGCIMGLVGAFAAILLVDWQRTKAKIAMKQLRAIAFIIALQVVFDLNTPQISFVGHTSGVIIGFFMGLVLKLSLIW